MGTRFALSKESPMHQRVKDLAYRSTEQDTVYTDRIDGMGTRFLDTERVRTMARTMSPLQALRSIPRVKRALRLSWPEVFWAGLRAGPDIRKSLGQARIAGDTFEGLTGGDYERGIVPGGQIVGAIDGARSCEEIVQQTIADAERILRERASPATQPPARQAKELESTSESPLP
jgi:enoyl-[acyl-carrier protein] reductase II